MKLQSIELSSDDRNAMREAFMRCQRKTVSEAQEWSMLAGGPLDGLRFAETPELRNSEFVAYCKPLSAGLVQVFYRRGEVNTRVFEHCKLME